MRVKTGRRLGALMIAVGGLAAGGTTAWALEQLAHWTASLGASVEAGLWTAGGFACWWIVRRLWPWSE